MAKKFSELDPVSSLDGTESIPVVQSGTSKLGTASQVLALREIADYTALRAYSGGQTVFRISASGVAGIFRVDASDTTSADNGGTIIVDALSQRWKREYVGAVSPRWFGALGSGADDTTAVQAAVALGGRILFDEVFSIASEIDVTVDATELVFVRGGGLSYATATNNALNVSAANCKISGGVITAPATFDGTNVQPTYAVVYVTGSGCEIDGLRISNAPKVGIFFKDVNNGIVSNCRIDGNYPTASFTGTQTGHAGILIDANSTGEQGGFVVQGSRISGCVQGVLIANYGSASDSQGMAISGNSFFSCWNHGVYAAGDCNGITVSANSFAGCQIPVAMTGANHSVVGNAMQTQSTGEYSDMTGISMRDSIGCVVSSNTIKGDADTSGAMISFSAVSGTEISNNVISGNSIVLSGGAATAIRVGNGTTATTVDNNVVTNNVVKANGAASIGLVSIIGTSGGQALGNIVSGNTIINTADSHGIHLSYTQYGTVSGNSVRLEYDAGSAKTLAGVYLVSATDTNVSNNSIAVNASWGANVAYRGIWETTGSSGNKTSGNLMSLSPTKLTSATLFVTLSGSGIVVDESGAGAPNLNAGVGSRWLRTDGGAGTTLYVKESGTGATGWVGK